MEWPSRFPANAFSFIPHLKRNTIFLFFFLPFPLPSESLELASGNEKQKAKGQERGRLTLQGFVLFFPLHQDYNYEDFTGRN